MEYKSLRCEQWSKMCHSYNIRYTQSFVACVLVKCGGTNVLRVTKSHLCGWSNERDKFKYIQFKIKVLNGDDDNSAVKEPIERILI